MLFLITGAKEELAEVSAEVGRIFISGLHPEPIVALEVVRRLGGIRKVSALSAKEAEAWRNAHNSTLSALPWRCSVLSDGTEWRTETEMCAETFLDLHRADYVPTHCAPARST